MKVGLAQIDCVPSDIDNNIKKFDQFAYHAKSLGCELIVFPEMSDTGYITSLIPKVAQHWSESGKSYISASNAARLNSINLICGISEKVGDDIYNSIAYFDINGKLKGSYRKAHLFSPFPVCEDKCFRAGDSLSTIDIGGINWGLSICFDLRFPEVYRYLTLKGANVLLNCSAWPITRPSHWDHLTRARAIENQSFFIGVNRVGTDGEITFNGHSRIVSPLGDLIVEGTHDKEEILVGKIDIEQVIQFRNAIPAINARRDDIYYLSNRLVP